MTELPREEFANPGPLRDALVAAILDGTKTSTTSLHADYAAEGEVLPQAGDRGAVVDSEDQVVAVIETEKLAAYWGRTGATIPKPIAMENAAMTSTQICRGIRSTGTSADGEGGEAEDMTHPLCAHGARSPRAGDPLTSPAANGGVSVGAPISADPQEGA